MTAFNIYFSGELQGKEKTRLELIMFKKPQQ